MAKAALNCQTVTLARELEATGEDILVVSLYPGFVATKLTEYEFRDDMVTCIAGMMDVIQKSSKEDNGKFIKWDGEILPW